MSDIVRTEDQRRWAVIQGIAMVFFVFFYGFQYTNYFVAYRLNASYVMYASIIFVVFHFYFMRIIKVPEVKIYAFYIVWIFISRLLNGDLYLEKDFNLIFEALLMMSFLPTAMMLDAGQRKKMFVAISLGIGLYFAVVAVFVVLAAVLGTTYANPLCPDNEFVNMWYGNRACVFGTNPNHCAVWFFYGFWSFVYLVSVVKNKLCKSLFIVFAALNALAFIFAYSRNVLIAFSVTFSIFIAHILIRYLADKKIILRIVCTVLVLVIFVPGLYFGCEKTYELLYGAGVEAQSEISADTEKKVVTGTADTEEQVETDTASGRGFGDSGRGAIYKAVFKTLLAEPEILLKGKINSETMDTVNRIYIENGGKRIYGEPHNTVLFVTLLAGIPGALLAVAFMICLIRRMIRLYFNANPNIKPEHIALAMPAAGIMMYSMLETCLFRSFDVRSILFMVFAGAVIAYEKELCK